MKVKKIITWIITALLVIGFILSGYIKVTGSPEVVSDFEHWGYPWFFIYVVGIAELISAIGLLFRKIRPWAALTLVALMAGAIGTHLLNDELSMIWGAVFNLLLLIVFLGLRKEEWSLHLTKTPEVSN